MRVHWGQLRPFAIAPWSPYANAGDGSKNIVLFLSPFLKSFLLILPSILPAQGAIMPSCP